MFRSMALRMSAAFAALMVAVVGAADALASEPRGQEEGRVGRQRPRGDRAPAVSRWGTRLAGHGAACGRRDRGGARRAGGLVRVASRSPAPPRLTAGGGGGARRHRSPPLVAATGSRGQSSPRQWMMPPSDVLVGTPRVGRLRPAGHRPGPCRRAGTCRRTGSRRRALRCTPASCRSRTPPRWTTARRSTPLPTATRARPGHASPNARSGRSGEPVGPARPPGRARTGGGEDPLVGDAVGAASRHGGSSPVGCVGRRRECAEVKMPPTGEQDRPGRTGEVLAPSRAVGCHGEDVDGAIAERGSVLGDDGASEVRRPLADAVSWNHVWTHLASRVAGEEVDASGARAGSRGRVGRRRPSRKIQDTDQLAPSLVLQTEETG